MLSPKGILLAGGHGTRLRPMTLALSKHLMPVYDKPMIYYPLTTLMLAGIQDILVISTSRDIGLFTLLLGDGSHWGINISYAVQKEPEGIAQVFSIAKDFIMDKQCALVLGDNIHYGSQLKESLYRAVARKRGMTLFICYTDEPHKYGIMTFTNTNEILKIEEKPKTSSSNHAVTGLYFYDSDVLEISKEIQPSLRNELEITDINNIYLKRKEIFVEFIEERNTWFDTGSPKSLLDASISISNLERLKGIKIGSPEEIAYKNDWIDSEKLEETLCLLYGHKSNYTIFLRKILLEDSNI